MAVVKAISTQELAALANRLRLTLIRDRMEEMLTMAVDKKLSPRETLEFFFRQEIRRREENRIRQGIMGAHFPAVRTLECKIQPFPWRIPKFPWQPAQQRPKWHQFSEFVAQLVLHRLFLCPKKARNLAKWKAQTCPPADRALTFMSGL